MSGLAAAAAVLLIAAGVVKLRRPVTAADAVTGAQVRVPRWLRSTTAVRLLGLGEIALGLWSLISGGSGYLALAMAYALLAAFAVRLRTVDRRAPCGCFGAASGGVSAFHIVTCVAAAAAALSAAALDAPSALDQTAGLGALGAAYVPLVGALSYVSFLLMADLPRLLEVAAARPARSAIRA